MKRPGNFAGGLVLVHASRPFRLSSDDTLYSHCGHAFKPCSTPYKTPEGWLVAVCATEAGLAGNLPAGAVLNWACPPAYVEPFAIVHKGGLTGGSDAEEEKPMSMGDAVNDVSNLRERVRVGTKVRSVRHGSRMGGLFPKTALATVVRLNAVQNGIRFDFIAELDSGVKPVSGHWNSQGFMWEELEAGDVVIVDDAEKSASPTASWEPDVHFTITAQIPPRVNLARALFLEEHAAEIEQFAEIRDRDGKERPDAAKHIERVGQAMWIRAGNAAHKAYEERAAKLMGGGK